MVPAPAVGRAGRPRQAATSEVAVLAGGCFWGVQGVFQHVNGVTNAVSGYAGGDKKTARVRVVGTGKTGHAESVQVTFDPRKISYGRILQIYFSVAHDPTQLNRQGPDYRHAVSLGDLPDQRGAGAGRQGLHRPARPGARLPCRRSSPRSSRIKHFYPAEDYHQDFLTRNPTYPYIVFNDLPKIEDLKQMFPEVYRPDPVLVAAGRVSN